MIESKDIPPQYDAADTEPAIYDAWRDAGVFTADPDASVRRGGPRAPFTIVIPPPNVTAVLHMGHGLNNTVQDVIVRWRRMAADETLWVPGTDHAGIATQNVIEKQLAREGLSRYDVGREAFVARTKEFVADTGCVILKQLEAIGCSCDWTRTAYTLSPDLSRAVREAFVRLWERDLIGQYVLLPIVHIPIPVVGDAYTDPTFGTGVVKITPAHDANDFEVGQRHGLPQPVIMTADAVMDEVSDAAGRVPDGIRGLDRDAARERIVALLGAAGRLEKVEAHPHAVRRCYRCETVVEPRLSDQWFVRMAPLAAPALAAHRRGETRVLPERWDAVYVNWLEGIRDWNISRQLWWGHRIPVWYCDACGGEPIVSRTDVESCPTCVGPERQDEDVLDT